VREGRLRTLPLEQQQAKQPRATRHHQGTWHPCGMISCCSQQGCCGCNCYGADYIPCCAD
jgi:hypothetical protein